MEQNALNPAAGPAAGPTAGSATTPGNGKVGKTAGSAHDAVDSAVISANSAIDNAANKAKPIISRAADTAHQAVDKAVKLAEAPAEWIGKKSQDLKGTQEKFVTDARDYISASPIKAVAIAVAAGLVIGRLMR